MAVAPSLTRRAGWPLAAVVAIAFLAALALHGERPEPGLAQFKAAGLLTAFAPDDVDEVEIANGGETWRFRRAGGAWQAEQGPRPAPAEAGARINTALRLLRDAGPMRTLSADEVSQASSADFGVGPDALRITARGPGGATFVIRFGARNPLGSARYAVVDGMEGVPLLPAYVAETWEQAIGATPR